MTEQLSLSQCVKERDLLVETIFYLQRGEGNGTPLQYSCLENPMDGSLVGCSPWGHKESDTTERLNNSKVALAVKSPPANTGDSRHVGWIPGWERLPGVANATHFSVLAWEISWTEEPGRLQSMGPQRVCHA